ncbi:MAG: hypothetical protein DME95_00520 [Verrucomicrobia bacterium]|nr:MAG: hypothetical protein DME95_00520 [Verrucomicrobiota bacterium]
MFRRWINQVGCAQKAHTREREKAAIRLTFFRARTQRPPITDRCSQITSRPRSLKIGEYEQE